MSAARYLHLRSFALRLMAVPKSELSPAQISGGPTDDNCDTNSFNTTAPVPKSTKPIAFYRPELDSLRFFAFFGVFICHTLPGAPEFYSAHHFPYLAGKLLQAISLAGAYGVDLFFLLSSYLITELLLREKDSDWAS